MAISRARRLLDKHPDKDFHCNLVAIAMCGSRVISYGFNSQKTNPDAKRITEKYNIKKMYAHSTNEFVSHCTHAEQNALRKADSDVDTLIVARTNANGEFANAKPCKICKKFIEERGVKEVFYTINGTFQKEVIS